MYNKENKESPERCCTCIYCVKYPTDKKIKYECMLKDYKEVNERGTCDKWELD